MIADRSGLLTLEEVEEMLARWIEARGPSEHIAELRQLKSTLEIPERPIQLSWLAGERVLR